MMSATENKTHSKPEIQFNEITFDAYTKEGLEPPSSERAIKARHDKFKSKFKKEKGPLQIIIKTMHRRPIVTFDDKGKAVKKDVLTYSNEYRGHDWLGNEINVLDNTEGVHYKPKFRSTTKLDPETGDHIVNKVFDGMTEEYYIELTEKNRKQVIEDIINKSNGTLIDDIKFYYHVPPSAKGGMSFRCDQYTYDQFINSSLDELERLARTTPTPVPYCSKDKKPYMG